MKLEDSFHKSPKNAYAIHWITSGVTFLIELIILGAYIQCGTILIGITL